MNYQKLRRQSFFQLQEPNFSEILTALSTDKKYDFLRNQATQISYTQFCFYARNFCRAYFNTEKIQVLDWGCGHGQNSVLLDDLGFDVQAGDVIECQSDRPLLAVKSIDFTAFNHQSKLPFDDQSFDAVFSFGVLEHVPDEIASLKEINRILRPGGLFFCFNLPYFYSWGQRLAHLRGNYYHDRLYQEKYVKSTLPKHNYQLLDLWHLGFFPKVSINYGQFSQIMEKIDQVLTNYTPLRYLATSLNFVARKQ